MGDEDHVILTPKRREVIEMEYEGSHSSERTHHSLVREKTPVALRELVDIAESPVIHNPGRFPAEDVLDLIRALLTAPDHLDPENPDDHTALMNHHKYREQLLEGLSEEITGTYRHPMLVDTIDESDSV